MSKYQLTKYDIENINQTKGMDIRVIKSVEEIKKWKLDDVLVAYDIFHDTNQRVLRLGSYNTPVKYKVVHIADYGVPFVKQLNTKGNPVGVIYSLLDLGDGNDMIHADDVELHLDPDFVDATIFQEEDKYDPTETQKQKRSLFKEIAAHNKASKIPLSTWTEVFDFMNSIKDHEHRTYWISERRGWTVQKLGFISKGQASHAMYRPLKNKMIPCLEVRNSRGVQESFMPYDLINTNLYHTQPRSYSKELKNPK